MVKENGKPLDLSELEDAIVALTAEHGEHLEQALQRLAGEISDTNLTPEQIAGLQKAARLDGMERTVRALLDLVRTQQRAAATATHQDLAVPLARVARALGRDRPALRRWESGSS